MKFLNMIGKFALFKMLQRLFCGKHHHSCKVTELYANEDDKNTETSDHPEFEEELFSQSQSNKPVNHCNPLWNKSSSTHNTTPVPFFVEDEEINAFSYQSNPEFNEDPDDPDDDPDLW